VTAQYSLFGPLQTTVIYQYRTALATAPAVRTLLATGGVRRLYAGAPYGVAHAALSKAGDTAFNALALTTMGGGAGGGPRSAPPTAAAAAAGDGGGGAPPPPSLGRVLAATAPASAAAAAWRTALLPLEVARTNLQAAGAAAGGSRLRAGLAAAGWRSLYAGGLASAASTGTGHLVFFSTLNALHGRLPAAPEGAGEGASLARWGALGLAASAAADAATNGFRVVTTAAQTRGAAAGGRGSYGALVRALARQPGGVWGLLGRGLGTRMASNGGQAVFFLVAWKGLEARVRVALGMDGDEG